MDHRQLADLLLDPPVHVPMLHLSPEEEAEIKAINWNEIFLFDDEE
jgi:hypothetical protein